jgi:hypothetical protein
MLLDLVDKLLDRCIQLAKRKEEEHRALFEDFVEPAYATFEAVHNDYLETFRVYRRMLADGSVRLTKDHPIFDKLREDSLFSQGKRAKLEVLQPLQTHPEMGAFITAISCYLALSTSRLSALHRTVAPDTPKSQIRNPIRTYLRDDLLSRIARGDVLVQGVPSVVAVEALDGVLESIQSEYSHVASEYETLKKKLLG